MGPGGGAGLSIGFCCLLGGRAMDGSGVSSSFGDFIWVEIRLMLTLSWDTGRGERGAEGQRILRCVMVAWRGYLSQNRGGLFERSDDDENWNLLLPRAVAA